MPIKGLTGQKRAFVEIGQLRKGAKKTDPKRPGQDLTYFRATFNEGEEEAAKMFFDEYGEEPRAIEVFLPFDEPDANFDTSKEAYLAGGLVHRCDGEYIEYAVDPESGEVMVKNGRHIETSERVKCDGQPVAHWTDEHGKQQPVFCEPQGRLKVIVPQLRRLAYMIALTTSIWDIVNLDAELNGCWWECNQKLRGIRFILKRVPKMVSTPSGKGGKRIRRKKWLLHIEPAQSWVEEQFLALEQAARPKLIESPLELPPGIPDTNGADNGEVVEGEVVYDIEEGSQEWEHERPVYEVDEISDDDAPKGMNVFYPEAEKRLGISKVDAVKTITAFLESKHGEGATIKAYVDMVQDDAEVAAYFWRILKGALQPSQEEFPF